MIPGDLRQKPKGPSNRERTECRIEASNRGPRRYALGNVVDRKHQSDELRQEMAKLDQQLLAALDKRARAARRLRELRKDNVPQISVADHAAIGSLVSRSTGDMPPEALRNIFREVFGACLNLELEARVAYVGPEGGLAHDAAGGRFGHGANLVGAETTAAALELLGRSSAEFAVVPFESSTEGPVQSTILALLASDLRVVEMLDVSIQLHLLNVGGKTSAIERVCVAASDRRLCEHFVAACAPRIAVEDVQTPRMACERAAQDATAAAVANETLGAQLGLDVAQRNVSDQSGARARYAVIGARPSGRTGADVTLLLFTVADAASSLVDVLRVFADRGIHLRNIRSHPVRAQPWGYVFCAELDGHFTDRSLVSAFEEMKRLARSFKILGSYPLV
jgi:chorismate mutase/prephenate dehydratase